MKKFVLSLLMSIMASGFIFATEIDDLLFSLMKDEVRQYGKQTYLLEEFYKSEDFVKKISATLVESMELDAKGFVFDRILEDDENFLVVYNRAAEKVENKSDNYIIIEQSRGNLFLILFSKEKCCIDAVLFF